MANTRRLAPLVFVLAACSTIVQGWLTHSFHSGPGYESFRIATSLVERHAFADPFPPLATGPTAHLAPVYPAIMAVSIALLGEQNGWGMFGFTLLLHGLYATLLPVASRALLGRTAPGLVAAFLVIALPLLLPNVAWEATLTAVLVLVLIIYSARRWSGLLSGFLLLVNPATLFVNLPLDGIFKRKSRLLFLALTALVCLPWIVRNFIVFHQFVFIRDNFGLELYAANNDCAGPSLYDNFVTRCFDKVHPTASPAVAGLVREMGEISFNQARMKLGREWISTHHARFIQLTLARIGDFWWPPLDDQPVHAWCLRLLFLISLPGLWLIARQHPRAFLLMVAILILYPLPYYVVQYSYRFEYPILWIPLLGAGTAVSRVFPRLETEYP
jgi:hypothetical protein